MQENGMNKENVMEKVCKYEQKAINMKDFGRVINRKALEGCSIKMVMYMKDFDRMMNIMEKESIIHLMDLYTKDIELTINWKDKEKKCFKMDKNLLEIIQKD